MAGNRFIGAFAPIATGASTDKIVLQFTAPAGIKIKLTAISVSFEGGTSTNLPILARLMRLSAAGTGTTLVLEKKNPADATSIQTAALEIVAGGTQTGNPLWEEYIHPMTGAAQQSIFGDEIWVAGGASVAIVTNAPNSVNVVGWLSAEE